MYPVGVRLSLVGRGRCRKPPLVWGRRGENTYMQRRMGVGRS